MKKILCVLISAILLSCCCFYAIAAGESARTIVIFKTSGNVKMTKGTAREFDAKNGAKLFNGYTVSTGTDSGATLKLDDDTLVKIDQKSKISVSKASFNKLSISVLSGAVSVDAAPQKTGDTLEVRAGNSALAVRGTSFIVECERDSSVLIIMFSGGGEVDGKPLGAGRIMTVTDSRTEEQTIYNIRDLRMSQDLSLFALETIYQHRQELVGLGIFTQQEIDSLPRMINEARRELQANERENTLLRQRERGQIQDTDNRRQSSSSSGGGSSGGGSSGGGNSGGGSSGGGNSGGDVPPPVVDPPDPEGVVAILNGVEYHSLTDAVNAANALAGAGTPALVEVVADCDNDDELWLSSEVTLEIKSGVDVWNELEFGLHPGSRLNNHGAFWNNNIDAAFYLNGGTLVNYGDVVNCGNMKLSAGAVFENKNDFHNWNLFELNGGTFNNTDSIYNTNYGSIPAAFNLNYGYYSGKLDIFGYPDATVAIGPVGDGLTLGNDCLTGITYRLYSSSGNLITNPQDLSGNSYEWDDGLGESSVGGWRQQGGPPIDPIPDLDPLTVAVVNGVQYESLADAVYAANDLAYEGTPAHIEVVADCDNDDELYLDDGVTLEIKTVVTLTNNLEMGLREGSKLINNGAFINSGSFYLYGGAFTNNGSISNFRALELIEGCFYGKLSVDGDDEAAIRFGAISSEPEAERLYVEDDSIAGLTYKFYNSDGNAIILADEVSDVTFVWATNINSPDGSSYTLTGWKQQPSLG